MGISIHAPRAGCDQGHAIIVRDLINFNPRTPCGVRPSSAVSDGCSCYFNPRTPCGVRPTIPVCFCKRALFQSTHPVRGATENKVIIIDESQFQSTHPVRGATLTIISILPTLQISIHAPRAGCDCACMCYYIITERISIHAPRAGCDVKNMQAMYREMYFNPRTPCGVRLKIIDNTEVSKNFNPRTPCGVRRCFLQKRQLPSQFQSTHPVRGATDSVSFSKSASEISIHAPRAGCDCLGSPRSCPWR